MIWMMEITNSMTLTDIIQKIKEEVESIKNQFKF